MKNNKKLKLILMILICIVIILIGFVGIYARRSNSYKNILPNFSLASDIKGTTVIELEVDNSNKTIYYDEDGKKVDSSEVDDEANYEKEEVPVNEQENLNKENYNKTLKIMKKRLELLAADQFYLDLDEKTGKIILNVEDDYIEDIESILPMEGKFQIIDSDTDEVIIDYSDFKSAEATYAGLDDGYNTYINLKLNDSGVNKLTDLFEKINQNENTEQEDTEEDAEQEDTEQEEDYTYREVKVMFDSDEICEIYYSEMELNGRTLRIKTDESLTTNSEINSRINIDTIVSKLATFGKLPVIYNITSEEYIQSETKDYIAYIVISVIALCVLISIVLIVKYKLNGLISVFGFITNIALFLIIIKLTNIPISLNGIVGSIVLIILYGILSNNILKLIREKNYKSFGDAVKFGYLNSINVLVISLFIFIIFSFSNMTVINSMGLLIFWGWLITVVGNLIITVPMLSIVNRK